MNSPSHAIQQQQQQHIRHRSLSQVAGVNAGVRLSSVSSQDSGFTSQDTLVLRPNSSPPSNQLLAQEVTNKIAIVINSSLSSIVLPFSAFFSVFRVTQRWWLVRAPPVAESVRVPTATRARPARPIHLAWAPLGLTFKYISSTTNQILLPLSLCSFSLFLKSIAWSFLLSMAKRRGFLLSFCET